MDHWHFLRYDDPSWHLRVRFHGSPETLTGVVLPKLHSAVATAVKRKLVWQYQLDTYVRETQRYGGHQAIPIAEEIFWADSEAAADVLAHMCATRDENVRLLVALYSVDRLMSDFGLTLDDKAGFTHSRRRELDGWLRVDLPAKRRLGENYRRLRTAIVEAIEHGQSPFAGGNGLSAFARRASRVVSRVTQLKCYEAGGELTEPVRALLPHFVHMSLNRLWTHPSLADELAVYDLLCRHYEHVARRR
jgi:thiopeptide-type bacteriocin biosynthesis protein